MSYEVGAVKYFVNTLFTVRGYISFYIFGDGIWNTVEHFQTLLRLATSDNPQDVIETLIAVYTPMGVAGWILSAFIFPVIGGVVATFLWYIFTPRR